MIRCSVVPAALGTCRKMWRSASIRAGRKRIVAPEPRPGRILTRMKRALVTGSSGLIGSETAEDLDTRGWLVHGVDNNMRRDFFGEHGDTTWNLERLRNATQRFEHHDLDIRDRDGLARL